MKQENYSNNPGSCARSCLEAKRLCYTTGKYSGELGKQQGATFVSWLVGVAIFLFLGITGIKLAPVYMEYYTIKGMVDEFAENPETRKANKRMLRDAIDRRLNINSLDRHLSAKNFTIEKIKGSKRRQITVQYDVRKPWFANLDFIATFNYTKEIGID